MFKYKQYNLDNICFSAVLGALSRIIIFLPTFRDERLADDIGYASRTTHLKITYIDDISKSTHDTTLFHIHHETMEA
jgi:hypothetical protein